MFKYILCISLLLSACATTRKLDICYNTYGKVESCIKVYNDAQLQKHKGML